MRQHERRSSGSRSSRSLSRVMAVVALPLALSACNPPPEQSAGYEAGYSIADITAEPTEFYGQGVNVSGEINEVLSQQAFTLGGEEFLGGNELLVISKKPVPSIPDRPAEQTVVEDDIALAGGVVRKFVLADVEKEAGLDLDDALFEEYADKPVLIAEKVVLSPRLKPEAAPAAAANLGEEPAGTELEGPITSEVMLVTPANLNRLSGRTVDTPAQVRRLAGNRAFFVGPNEDQQVIVVMDEGSNVRVTPGQKVRITGAVHPIPENAAQEWGLDATDGDGLGTRGGYVRAEQVVVVP